MFVEKGLITEEQLEAALEQQRATGDRLGEILVEQFGIERLDLASALAEQWAEYERQGSNEERASQSEKRDLLAVSDEWRPSEGSDPETKASIKRPIGEIFVERGLVSDEQLEQALDQQKKTGTRLGEILVASGKLSRLELASALADQWASFQKLRPPEESAAPRANGDVTPTPEVVAAAPVAPSELGNRVDALATRVDQLAADKVDWKPQLEKTAELLRARLEHLEELVARQPAAAEADDVRGELATLAERIEAIPAPTDEWRLELAQVAENLRTRIERVEQVSAAEQLAALRTALDGLVERVDSLPAPSDEWRQATEELARRMDSLAVSSSEGWQGAISELSSRIDSLPAPTEDWRDAIAELSTRIDSLPAPSEDWRDAIAGIDARIAELGNAGDDVGADVHAALEALVERVDGLLEPSEEWRGEIAGIREQIEQTRHSRESDLGELLALVDALGARLDALPVDAWRPELAEVAENLRTRVERVEQRPSGAEELHVALKDLEARLDALPQPSDEWRGEIAGIREQIEQIRGSRESGVGELRGLVDELAARLDSLPQPSEEWRVLVAGLEARIDALPVDAWRTELAEVAENLRIRVERVEQRPSGAEELTELRADLAHLGARLDGLPQPSEEWRGLVAGLAERVDALTTDDWRAEAAQAVDTLNTRVERIEIGMNGQARAAAVTEIAEQVGELARKVADTGIDAVEEKMHALSARLEALPAFDEWREPLAELAARIDGLPVPSEEWREPLAELVARIDGIPAPSEEWREQIASLAARVDTLRTDEWRLELGQVAENLRTRLERVEHELGSAQTEQLDGLRSGLDELVGRVDSMSVVSFDGIRAELAELAQALHGRIEHVEQHVAHEVRAEALDALVARIDELSGKVDDASSLESRLAESLSALVHERAEQFEAGGADVRRRLDDALREIAAVAGVAGRMTEVESRLDAEASAATGIAPQLDELKQAADRHTRRAEKLSGRIDELASRRDAGEIEEALGARLDATEGALGEVRAAIDALPASVEERISAAEARAASGSRQASTDVESLRRELDDLRAVVSATGEAAAGRIDGVAETLHNELAAVTEQFVRTDTVVELRSAIDRQDEHIEGLGGRLISFERRVEDNSAGRTAELTALQQRLDAVESALAGTGGWKEAVDTAEARIESVELRLIESSSSEAVERNAEIEGVRSELAGRVDQLEAAQVKRKDVRELSEAVERVERRVDDRLAQDEAAVRATETAVREGIASLGERLSASGDAYLESGRELSRSLAGLGLALAAADAHGVGTPRSTDRPAELSVFLAFAPTADGYRLVECAGAPPALDDEVNIEDCDGPLVVTRVGASPLPFDSRRCVYLERS